MFTPRAIVNALSLSRIALAILFVLIFQPIPALLYVSTGLCAAALVTDVLDGFIARRMGVASVEARHWDSLGDKAFYVGIIIGFLSNGLLGPTLSWALLVREIALYVTRILYIRNMPEIERIRPYTNWHGYFMYAVIILGLACMFAQTHQRPVDLYIYIQLAGLGALMSGIASVFAFMQLSREE